MRLIDPNNESERLRYLLYGEVDALFGICGKPRRPPSFITYKAESEEDTQLCVFDNVTKKWANKYLYEIPKTYTFTPFPPDAFVALDYYIKSVALVKHTFIWSKDSIPFNDYANVRSETNKAYRGRFTLVSGLPKLNGLFHTGQTIVPVNPFDLQFMIGPMSVLPPRIGNHHFYWSDSETDDSDSESDSNERNESDESDDASEFDDMDMVDIEN